MLEGGRIFLNGGWTVPGPTDKPDLSLDCPWSARQNLTSRRRAFNRLGTDAAKMTVATGSVVKNLDVIEYISPS